MVTDLPLERLFADHIQVRDDLVKELIAELHGPTTKGSPYSRSAKRVFSDWKESRGPWKDADSGQEILSELTPHQQYGIGVLLPVDMASKEQTSSASSELIAFELEVPDEAENAFPIDGDTSNDIEMISKSFAKGVVSDDIDLSEPDTDQEATLFRGQSSLGISFLIENAPKTELSVELTGGCYDDFYASIASYPDRQWWIRQPICEQVIFTIDHQSQHSRKKQTILFPSANPAITADIEVKTRRFRNDPNRTLVTVSVTNRSKIGSIDKRSIFQTKLRCSLNGHPGILPYPSWQTVALSDDEKSSNLLYRNVAPFAVGHGCAASWTMDHTMPDRAIEVCTDTVPSITLPPVTPEILRSDGTTMDFSMADLSVVADGSFRAVLQELVDSYRVWISEQFSRVSSLTDAEHQSTAKRHLNSCQAMSDRIEDGISFLESDPKAARAFSLANRAMLYQRVRSRKKRTQVFNAEAGRVTFDPPFVSLEESLRNSDQAKWRPFQLAFLLANLKSTADGTDRNRRTVDLLWFPTGGGKTEAYLGLSAFSIFYRRLRDVNDIGTTVLMRYTLRLLTAQQFQRASALICSMEAIRADHPLELGTKPIRIGMWVGGGSTPNRSSHAIELLKKMKRFESDLAASFVLDCCPWCGAQMIPDPPSGRKRFGAKNSPMKWGYQSEAGSVAVSCTDALCPFKAGLPISVIDDKLYATPPDFLLGTIDKFAQLAWRDDARSLFGLDASGEHAVSPPSLIIQDELHLIAGPLGSIAGGYEPVIEDLCTDKRNGDSIPPKLIASTATIQGYREHVSALFGRSDVALFPPPGLDANESYFARIARKPDGAPMPGKRYLGIMAPGYKSHQNAIARVIGTMHQLVGQLPMDNEVRNPWWTNLLFFGSLRELGNSLTLISSGIPTFIKLAARRSGRNDRGDQRFIRNAIELTGRLSGSEIPKQLAAIETDFQLNSDGRPSRAAVDLCLATNIIEVGIDVDRLSLMTVIGQPKSMASYIQATGRVGRKWETQPGLIMTVFSPTRARDRSYYEQFRSVHERLYSQVEPTTLTPYALPALERTLHCAMIAYVRQRMMQGSIPDPVPNDLIDQFWQLLETRLKEEPFTQFHDSSRSIFERRRLEWNKRRPTRWDAVDDTEIGLAHRAGEYVPNLIRNSSWSVLSSMRNVDADCRLSVPWPSDMSTDEEPE